MNRIFLTYTILLFSAVNLFAQTWSIGSSAQVYPYEGAAGSGLDKIYVVKNKAGLTLSYESFNNDPISVYSFTYDASSEPVEVTQNGNRVFINNPQVNTGYFIEQNGASSSPVWIMSHTPIVINSVNADESLSDCDLTRLIIDFTASDLAYYSRSGNRYTIQRYLDVSYNTMEWKDKQSGFVVCAVNLPERAYREINISSPYCDTEFIVKGDQFQKFWNEESKVVSELYHAKAVTGKAVATQIVRDSGNELESQGGELSGSAPIDVSFSGYSNYPLTTYQAWQISKDISFESIEASYGETDLEYSFTDEGITYVRFIISNADSSCENVVEMFTISASESSLEVPNVFTPGASSGNNLEFKVVYRSIVKFEAWIFNRWGNELFHWTDPAKGWDGKYKGKIVPTGAYYYVIKAEGVGGKRYNLKGDINVLSTNK